MNLKINVGGRAILLIFLAAIGLNALAAPPKVVKTVPENGAQDVDPAIKNIRIGFDQDMNTGGYSVCGDENDPTYPKMGQVKWVSPRLFVIPVRLEGGHVYRFWLNSKNFKNFQSASGEPLEPVEFSFVTAPAGSGKKSPSSVKPSASTRSDLPDTGEKLQFSLPDVYGRIVTSQDYKGVPVFLEFGACW